ncbi:hypothetical protein D5H75_18820 [Bailinhaonella thermotolerans]|uniref:Uncharacterized protein n=1 Tax=Bailinhaonella thermotolerans TaxID=1070861 RepID=A0A3A4B2X8_9ACTN|nr:hypothetical protein D5H75_18820 [Bailinhaonella thermotolerans]
MGRALRPRGPDGGGGAEILPCPRGTAQRRRRRPPHHSGTAVTEAVYRLQIRPVLLAGATVMVVSSTGARTGS